MDSKQLFMYVIIDKKKKPHLYSLRLGKKECISAFINGSSLSWDETKKFGWKCIKVDVFIQSISNEDSWN